jgi:hypothetical protein
MRTSQEIFDLAINQRYYPWKRDAESSGFMCFALDLVYENNLITSEELSNTINDINQYIGTYNTLKMFLAEKDLPFEISDRIFIYQNWDNRP